MGVKRVSHFGPSKNIENYAKKLGELGEMAANRQLIFIVMASCYPKLNQILSPMQWTRNVDAKQCSSTLMNSRPAPVNHYMNAVMFVQVFVPVISLNVGP